MVIITLRSILMKISCMPLSLGTSIGPMVYVHPMNVISNIFHVINLISSIFGGAVAGQGARKPSVGDRIESRRPLSLFFFFPSPSSIFASTLVCIIIIIIIRKFGKPLGVYSSFKNLPSTGKRAGVRWNNDGHGHSKRLTP